MLNKILTLSYANLDILIKVVVLICMLPSIFHKHSSPALFIPRDIVASALFSSKSVGSHIILEI